MQSVLFAVFAAVCIGGIEGNTGRAAGGQNKPGVQRPNIVFLLADDLRPDCLGVLGHPIVKTPRIDRLLERGFIFRNVYVSAQTPARFHPQPHDDSDRSELSARQPHHPHARTDDQGGRVRLDPQWQARQ